MKNYIVTAILVLLRIKIMIRVVSSYLLVSVHIWKLILFKNMSWEGCAQKYSATWRKMYCYSSGCCCFFSSGCDCRPSCHVFSKLWNPHTRGTQNLSHGYQLWSTGSFMGLCGEFSKLKSSANSGKLFVIQPKTAGKLMPLSNIFNKVEYW